KVQIGGFMGFAVNAFAGFMNEDKLGGMLQDFVLAMLHDMGKPGNEYRESALHSIRGTISGLHENSEVVEEAERLKERLAAGGDWEESFTAMVGKLLEGI